MAIASLREHRPLRGRRKNRPQDRGGANQEAEGWTEGFSLRYDPEIPAGRKASQNLMQLPKISPGIVSTTLSPLVINCN